MISLAGRDIMHAWGKFVFTGMGLGLLIGVTLSMAGIYRGMVDDGKVLLDNSGADLWVVQKDTLGPYAESSSIYEDTWRAFAACRGGAGGQRHLPDHAGARRRPRRTRDGHRRHCRCARHSGLAALSRRRPPDYPRPLRGSGRHRHRISSSATVSGFAATSTPWSA